jgi:hypothetical protein
VCRACEASRRSCRGDGGGVGVESAQRADAGAGVHLLVRVSGFGFRVSAFESQEEEVRVSGFGLEVSGF